MAHHESYTVRNGVIIITSNLAMAIRVVLERNSIHCISEVIGAEHEKSKIRKITGVIARFSDLTPYYVGDTRGDMTRLSISPVIGSFRPSTALDLASVFTIKKLIK